MGRSSRSYSKPRAVNAFGKGCLCRAACFYSSRKEVPTVWKTVLNTWNGFSTARGRLGLRAKKTAESCISAIGLLLILMRASTTSFTPLAMQFFASGAI